MNKEELIQFLKDSLKIEIETNSNVSYNSGFTGYKIIVSIKINDAVISKSEDSINIR